ncbi:unannotated protein [freshwater metagenome]|uniref:Unannotated protein n=1 Tax=freshwater metagenome TaxID=449393 RepID=A0A6J7IRZ3_9ZZZZ|nr:hypothetical protein [Actinomycetota bacterium]
MSLEPDLVAIVVDALAAPQDAGLDHAAGAGSAQRLRAELRAIARRWVAATAPGMAYEATSPAAAFAALGDHHGPVVLVAPDVPRLSAGHAQAVRADLEAGVGMVIGPTHDRRPYLVAFAAPDLELLEAATDHWDALTALAATRGLDVSILRAERRLVSAADARAIALDPLASSALTDELRLLRELGRTGP